MPAAKKKTEKPLPTKFEDAMDELEGIVEEMEEAELPLEELIGQYSRGMKLVRLCEGKLSEAEQQVEVLTDETPPVAAEEAEFEPDAAVEEEPGEGEDRLF